MKKFYISCDIEGTCGIAAWEETMVTKPEYASFADQMSREVGAACEGLLAGGASNVFLRDAHATARNIRAHLLPQSSAVQLYRGWGRDPYGMMSGISNEFAGALFTGYHSACGWDGSPLSHTNNLNNFTITLNGEIMPELYANCLTAAMFGVPVLMVTGDQMICDWFHQRIPAGVTVPVSYGIGDGSVSIMPEEAIRRIREGAKQAARLNGADCLFPMPEHFCLEICYREHQRAKASSWYPGVVQTDSRTVRFEADDWMAVLTFLHFCK